MMKQNKGFSLVEMAIVLVIFGLIMAAASSILVLFVNKGGAERTRKMVESDKNALYSYVASQKQLPIKADFLKNVTYPRDGYDKDLHYYADPILEKSSAFSWSTASTSFYTTDVNPICGSFYTNTEVWICKTAACDADNDTNRTPVLNVAYVIISGSVNKNIQTGVDTTIKSGRNVIRVYKQGENGKDDYTTDTEDANRPEQYDDIVDWVTLDELRTGSGCAPEQYRFLNMTMPAAYLDKQYTFRFYGEGVLSNPSVNNNSTATPEYNWTVVDEDDLSSNVGFGVNMFTAEHTNNTSTNVDLGENHTARGNYLLLKGNASSFTKPQYRITVTVSDASYGADTSRGQEFTKTFLLNAQQ